MLYMCGSWFIEAQFWGACSAYHLGRLYPGEVKGWNNIGLVWVCIVTIWDLCIFSWTSGVLDDWMAKLAGSDNCFMLSAASLPSLSVRDYDGVVDSVDNCRVVANPEQSDIDGDSLGIPVFGLFE